MAEYSITIANNSTSPKTYVVFQADADGQPVAAAEPAAHEVGGHCGTTAAIVHHLLSGQGTPVKATLDIDGQVTELALAAA